MVDLLLKIRETLYFAPVNLNAEPGTSEWTYCSLPLSIELAKGLAGKWPSIEEICITTLKGVFQHLRAERETICQYFYNRGLSPLQWIHVTKFHIVHLSDSRHEFAEYLCRSDHKQEFVSQWQSS